MSPDAKRVFEAALALPERERIEMAEVLIDSLEPPTESALADVEAAWASEIAGRVKEVETGSVQPMPWDEAREAIFGSTPARLRAAERDDGGR